MSLLPSPGCLYGRFVVGRHERGRGRRNEPGGPRSGSVPVLHSPAVKGVHHARERLQGDRAGGNQPRVVGESAGRGRQAGLPVAPRATHRRGGPDGCPNRQGRIGRELPGQGPGLLQVRRTGLNLDSSNLTRPLSSNTLLVSRFVASSSTGRAELAIPLERKQLRKRLRNQGLCRGKSLVAIARTGADFAPARDAPVRRMSTTRTSAS